MRHRTRFLSRLPIQSIQNCFLFLLVLALTVPADPVPLRAQTKRPAASVSLAEAPPGFLYQGVPAEIPQDEGTAGLHLALRQLSTTARLMQTVAHPDDEDGGMLTLEARGHGVDTLLMTLNRGEGGQNKIGSNLSDVLGVLRALELLAADQYYGVQERFSHVADFGFSKSPDETFAKWGGHDPTLADMVRVVRTFRPDVLVARFSGTGRDGHGHHQASAILAKEAFRAAADPKRFPEQIAEGLEPWQARKFYVGNVCGFGATTCPDADWTLKLNTGEPSTDLGMSYVQFAMKGLRHQQSQGAANWQVDDGDRFTFYKLADSVIPSTLDKNGHEKDFFDGIDTTLPALASRLGNDETRIPHLRDELSLIAKNISAATQAAKSGNSSDATPLFSAQAELTHAIAEIKTSQLNPAARAELLSRLGEKLAQTETALNLALDVNLQADVASTNGASAPTAKESESLTTVSPGQEFLVAAKLHNGSKLPLAIDNIKLEVPQGWETAKGEAKHVAIKPGEDVRVNFRLQVPPHAAYTRPYWHRDDPDREAVNHIDDDRYATLPFPPPPLTVRVEYSANGKAGDTSHISAVVTARFIDESGAERSRPLAVVPAFSVMLEPGTQVISTHNGSTSTVTVGVTSNLSHDARGALKLELPSGWRSDPAQIPVEMAKRGEKKDFHFKVFSSGLQEGRATIRAVLDSNGDKFSEGYTLVTRADLGSFYYYQPARQRVSIVDVQVPHDLKVGYIMGAGDDIATVLQQMGMNVTLLPAETLASADLSQYGTIVLGIRAYDTQKDVATNNKKLFDFVSAGGTLVVQYNASVGDFNSGHFTPYPADLSRARVSVEEAPVTVLVPEDQIFHSPNTISEKDFDGWVQERGLYFMDQWDDHFKALLACNDPDEPPQKGGLLEAHYGKGIYIYTGYAFFRQLPAGVPGAVRLYVNILNAKGGDHP
jgi:LmbE family N-acetylglucosaminyl deacetylase